VKQASLPEHDAIAGLQGSGVNGKRTDQREALSWFGFQVTRNESAADERRSTWIRRRKRYAILVEDIFQTRLHPH
jgi:hypothetical protein